MRLLAGIAFFLTAVWLTAQASPACPVTQAYRGGEKLTYDLHLHSEIALPGGKAGGLTDSGQLDTTATVEFDVRSEPAPAQADVHFTAFQTSVQAAPAALADLKTVAAQYTSAALSMPVSRLQLGREARILSRPDGDQYDQALTILQDLAFGDSLPTRAVQVGDSWQVTRTEFIPALHTTLPSQMQVKLTGLDASGATLQIHSEGSVNLPPDQIPNRDQAMAAGLVPRDTVSFSSDGTERFRLADGVLLEIASHSNNKQHLTFTGARSVPPLDQTVTSSSSIKLAAEN